MRVLVVGLVFMLAFVLSAQQAQVVSHVGFVSDTWCGRKGANAQHGEHARRSVASGVAQYALYDEATKKLYIIEPQAIAAQYAGQRVKITGTLGATPLTRAGQSYAPDAVAAYIERAPSAATAASGQANGLRASGATTGGGVQGAASSAPTAARSTTPKVQSHEAALDQTTPIAGVLTISSIEAEPTPTKRRTTRIKH